MSKQNSAVERKGISTPETVSQRSQEGNTPHSDGPVAPTYIDSGWKRFSDKVYRAADVGAIQCAGPFVRYIENAAIAFQGIECVIGLVEASDIRKFSLEDGNEEHPIFSTVDRDALLALAKVSADLMANEASLLSDWADKHFVRAER